MNVDHISGAVVTWAASQPLVRKAYLYGSRVKGTHTRQSDFDVAVELNALPGDVTALATWLCEKEELKESLANSIAAKMHLEWYGGPDETPKVHAGLQSGSRLIYELASALENSHSDYLC